MHEEILIRLEDSPQLLGDSPWILGDSLYNPYVGVSPWVRRDSSQL